MTPAVTAADSRDRASSAGWAPSGRNLARASVVAATVSIAVIGFAGPASAHVTITPSSTAAGASTVVDVSVAHGCEDSPTTEVTIRIPDEVNSVAPTRNAMWEVQKEVTQLDPPVTDSHGNQLTERVASVTYTTDIPLPPDGYRDVFELSMQLPDTEGATLVFPTIQTCEQGESAWIEVAGAGQSQDDLELPAPALVITAAEGDGHGGMDPATNTAAAVGNREGPRAAQDSQDAPMLAAGALGAGLMGAVLGGVALVRQRRRT